MKKLLIASFILLIFSCTEDTSLPDPKVSFYLENELFESSSTLNVYAIDKSPTGLNELGIHITVGKKDLLLFCTTEDLEGTYTYENSLEGALHNRIGLCDEIDSIFCKSASKCETQEFIFTIERHEINSELLKGTFEGVVCNENGDPLRITEGTFENFQLFPKCC